LDVCIVNLNLKTSKNSYPLKEQNGTWESIIFALTNKLQEIFNAYPSIKVFYKILIMGQ
jgi:hypothetical protein